MQNHKVLILGPSNSGKTVFLSSMYYQLSMATSTNFFIEATKDYEGNTLLNNYLGLMTDWPENTLFADMKEFEFKCFVKTPKKSVQAFKITYYDYSGGRIQEAINEENQFKNIVDNADIFLSMIDGEKLLNSEKNNYLQFEMDKIFTTLNNKHQEGLPVHLLVSKWDLLHNRNISISEVRDKLMTFPRFVQLVQTVKANKGFLRLIPVSSVGFNFAEYHPNEEGNSKKMTKKSNASLEPYNVDVPLALALLDPMQSKFDKLQEDYEKLQRTEVQHISANLTWWERLQRWAGKKIEIFVEQNQIQVEELRNLANFWKKSGEEKIRYAKEKEVEMRENLKSRLHSVDDEKSATEYILYSFHTIETNLESNHPGSLIR